MHIYLAGTHGSGKTTLAQSLAKGLRAPLFTSQAGEIHKDFGVKASDEIPIHLRIKIQEEILEAWQRQYQEAQNQEYAIFDRTPLDFAAYLLSEVPRNLDPTLAMIISRYTKHCVDISSTLGNLFVVYPLETKLDDRGEDKPDVNNTPYAEAVHNHVVGTAMTAGIPFVQIKSDPLDVRMRVISDYMEGEFSEALEKIAREKGETLWANRLQN